MLYKQNQIALISSTLAEMIAQAERLARITAEEGVALREAKIDLINEKVRAKQEIVATLIEIDNRFRKILRQFGYSDTDEIASFLGSGDYDMELAQTWQRYLQIMERCEKNNRKNSALVNVGLRHTRQAIDFLRSCVGEYAEPPIYAPLKQRTTNTGCVIAKA
jgi:flagellar biosynthesis/type III secretory pathway chaperone